MAMDRVASRGSKEVDFTGRTMVRIQCMRGDSILDNREKPRKNCRAFLGVEKSRVLTQSGLPGNTLGNRLNLGGRHLCVGGYLAPALWHTSASLLTFCTSLPKESSFLMSFISQHFCFAARGSSPFFLAFMTFALRKIHFFTLNETQVLLNDSGCYTIM